MRLCETSFVYYCTYAYAVHVERTRVQYSVHAVQMAVEITHECRLCRAVVPTKRSTSLFSPLDRMGPPTTVFQHTCATNASDALYFLRKLPSSYHTFMNTGQEVSYSSSVGVIFYGSIKGTTRTKDTCGIVVAPASSSDQTSPTDLGYRLRRGRAHS